MTTPTWDTLSTDIRHALRTAATRLADEFAGIYGPETIERFLYSSYDQLVPNAAVTRFLPLLAERFARNSSILGQGRRPPRRRQTRGAVLVHPQRRALPDGARVLPSPHRRPGSRLVRRLRTGREVNPSAIAAMAERGIDISAGFPKPWNDETVRAADVVISMGCGDACPIFPGKRYESWDDLDDPAGLDLAAVRPIRDDIERRVRRLIEDLGVTEVAARVVQARP